MLKQVKKLIDEAAEHLQIKNKIRYAIKASAHFEERYLQRFEDDDLPLLERTVEKAIEKIKELNRPIRYTHPAYNITVVVTKQGLNGAELVTCWKGDEC